MTAAMPTMGFPSKTAAVLALRGSGKRPKDVGRILNLSRKQVHALEYGSKRGTVSFPRDVLSLLTSPAKQRGLSVSGLAIALVATAALDNVIDAIMDDDGVDYRPKPTKRRSKGRQKPKTSRFRGVRAQRGKFIAQIQHDKKQRHLGCFDTEIAAALAYNAAATELFGEDARLNQIP